MNRTGVAPSAEFDWGIVENAAAHASESGADFSVAPNLGLVVHSDVAEVVDTPDVTALLDKFEENLAESDLGLLDVLDEETVRILAQVRDLVQQLPEGNLSHGDLLALAERVRSLNGGVEHRMQGVAIFPLGRVSIPGTKVLRRHNGSVSLVVAPKGSMVPYHNVGSNAHYGFAPGDSSGDELILGMRGKLPVLKSNGHQADIHSSPFLESVSFGKYLSFGVQGDVWIGVIVQPMGTDVRKVSHSDASSPFKSSLLSF